MQLTILFFNDVHGYLQPHAEVFYEGENEVIDTVGGYARLAGYINQVKASKENVLVFDGGDTFHGTLPVVQTRGEILIPVLNKMNIEAMVGHWDFAYGPQHLQRLASQLNYPILGINVYNKEGGLFLKPYIIRQVNGIKIAVIGICSNIIDKTMPKQFSEGLVITDGSSELPVFIEKAKQEGADLIILLSHNGFPQDYHLLAKVNGIDVCLSAHTHNRLYEAVTVNNTIIIQCGCHGSFIGEMTINLKENKIADYSYELKVVDDTFPSDSDVQAIIDDALQPFKSLLSETAGYTPAVLHRYDTLNSRMDNLLLAAMLHNTSCDVAFSNGWRYGVPIPAGAITLNDLYNIIPHNPFISTTDLTGHEIRQMLEENLERTFSARPMQQMGGYIKRCFGLTAYIKIENPAGHRIQELFIGQERCESNKSYSAAFVTEQGVPEKYGSNRRHTGKKAVEALTDFLRSNLRTESIIQNKAFVTV